MLRRELGGAANPISEQHVVDAAAGRVDGSIGVSGEKCHRASINNWIRNHELFICLSRHCCKVKMCQSLALNQEQVCCMAKEFDADCAMENGLGEWYSLGSILFGI